jgi:hypothetical protein
LLLLIAVLAAREWTTAPMDHESGAGFGCLRLGAHPLVLIPWCSSLALTHAAAFTPLFYRSLLGRAQSAGAFDIP